MIEVSSFDLSTPVELPIELLLHILELTCVLSHDAALRVSLVASWVHRATKPYVFGTIVRRAGSLYPIQGRIELSHKTPPPGCGEHVRHLWLEGIDILSSPREMNLFKACPNVEDIALSVNSLRTLLSMYANPYSSPGTSSIRSLTLINPSPRTVWLVQPLRPLLDNITHLRMVDLQLSPYLPLEHLPNLTHLALPYMHLRTTNSDGLIRLPDNTSKCTRLKIILLTIDHYDWLYRPWLHRGRYITPGSTAVESPRDKFQMVCATAKAKDSRVHLMLSPIIGMQGEHTTVHSEWAAAARGGESIWDKAVRLSKDDSQLRLLPSVYPKPRLSLQDNAWGLEGLLGL